MKSYHFVIFPLFSAFLGACASTHFGFFPASAPGETIEASERGATFPVKIGEETGSLHVMSLGIVDLKSGTKEVHFPALHLREVITNEGTSQWVVNIRHQKVKLSEKGESIAAYAKSDSEKPPGVEIPPGETRQIDLFYPLPVGQQTSQTLPGFDFKTRITIGKDQSARIIPFFRQPTRRSLKPVYVNGPNQQQLQLYDQELISPQFWWYDPTYPGLAFPEVPAYAPMW